MSRKPAKPTEPARIADECLGLRVRLIDRAISSIYDEVMRPHGVTISQFTLLVAIVRHPGVQASRLGPALCLDASTLSRNLERLHTRRWIEDAHSDDPRSRPLRATKTGAELVARASKSWELAQQRVVELLGDQNANALVRIGERLRRT